jgi:hypothetical protein
MRERRKKANRKTRRKWRGRKMMMEGRREREGG